MPQKLPDPTVKVCWRVDPDDLALLNTLFPGAVNATVRVLLRAYCDRLRAGLKGDGRQV